MYDNPDIKMNLSDKLELDSIIKSWDTPENIIDIKKGSSYDLDGIQTNTGIFNPKESGEYKIGVNGQEIRINVVDSSNISIPDTVVDKFNAGDLGSSWENSGSGNDMTVNGLYQSTFSNGSTSATANGSTDYGIHQQYTLADKSKMGFACTLQTNGESGNLYGHTSTSGNESKHYVSINGAGPESSGNIQFRFSSDPNNDANVYTTNETLDDGNIHTVIFNKPNDDPNNWEVYVDDMSTPVSTSKTKDQGYDHSKSGADRDRAYFATNNQGSIQNNLSINVGTFEFMSDTYTQSQRENFISRRTEV